MGIGPSVLGMRGSDASGLVGQARRHYDASARFYRRAWGERRGSAAVMAGRVMPKGKDLVPMAQLSLLHVP